MKTIRRSFLLTICSPIAFGAVACSAVNGTGSNHHAIRTPRTDMEASIVNTLTTLAGYADEQKMDNGFSKGIRVGTVQGREASRWIAQQMQALGLQVRFENHNFPMHVADHANSSFSAEHWVTSLNPFASGDWESIGDNVGFDLFEASGDTAGATLDGDLVWVGNAKPEQFRTGNMLMGEQEMDLTGKICFVQRDSSYHRSEQYKNCVNHHALAMLYQSTAAENQVQIGSIRLAWEPMGAIPAISIGQQDANKLTKSVGGTLPRAHIRASASTRKGTGRNVVGSLKGKDDSHHIVVGAHYDTWYTGTTDNSSGVAGLIELARLITSHYSVDNPPQYSIDFVAFDGEEVGLFGGYDFLRKHLGDPAHPSLLAVVNLEMPSSEGDLFHGGVESYLAGIASSVADAMNRQVPAAELAGTAYSEGIPDNFQNAFSLVTTPYKAWLSLNFIAKMFGGIIPTDIQGWYRGNLATLTTATDSPFYHTPNDTPETFDQTNDALSFLERAVRRFDVTIAGNQMSGGSVGGFQGEPVDAFVGKDPKVYDADFSVTTQSDGSVTANATVYGKNSDGTRGDALPNRGVTLTFFCDDFFAAPDLALTTDGDGKVAKTWSPDEITAGITSDPNLHKTTCDGRRWVHITANGSDGYPVLEKIAAAGGQAAADDDVSDALAHPDQDNAKVGP